MDTLYKLLLFFLFVFFLLSNAKAGKSAYDEGILNSRTIPSPTHYSLVLPAKKDFNR